MTVVCVCYFYVTITSHLSPSGTPASLACGRVPFNTCSYSSGSNKLGTWYAIPVWHIVPLLCTVPFIFQALTYFFWFSLLLSQFNEYIYEYICFEIRIIKELSFRWQSSREPTYKWQKEVITECKSNKGNKSVFSQIIVFRKLNTKTIQIYFSAIMNSIMHTSPELRMLLMSSRNSSTTI